ncbi:MAG: GH116 family glycosyl-hydrolase [Armatimonadota bacterium]|nr:GH116 family glycosyl-hydrolase [Armatimonadota bacterium]
MPDRDAHRCSDEEFEEWASHVMDPVERIVYSGSSLRAVAMPMGGLGAGSVALAGDGTLRQWQVLNQVNHTAFLPGTFFAVRAQAAGAGEAPVSRLLQTDCFYDDDFEPAESTSDHVIPDEARRLAGMLPCVSDIEYVGEYPIARLRYVDDDLLVEVRLEAFTPLIPLNSKDSGLPCAVFVFEVENTSDARMEVALLGSLQNAVGYDAGSGIAGTRCPCYGGNVNEALVREGRTAVEMTNARLPADHPGQGSMALAALSEGCSVTERWNDPRALWEAFVNNGRLLPAAPAGESRDGSTFNAAVAAHMFLAPGETGRQVFVIAWHFPNHHVNWNQSGFGITDTKSRFWLGNMYANWFDCAMDVVDYVQEHQDRLAERTRLYRDTLYNTTLPYWFIDRVSSQAATLRTQTCLWNEDGNFHGFEGARGAVHGIWGLAEGCCPLNCTHVWNYEMTLSRLFPDLERTMRRTDLKVQLTDEGGVIFRTVLPLYLPRWQADDDSGRTNIACDGHWGTILKVCREWQQSGSDEFLDEMWPEVVRAVEYGFERWDDDADGVLDGPQWNTYDLYFYGHNTYCSLLYLAALLAVEEMATWRGETELAEQCRRRFESGGGRIDEELFNGEYYEQHLDESIEGADRRQYGRGCLSDQLFGQWWAHSLDLGYLLDPQRVRAALQSVYRYNFQHDFVDYHQQPRVFVSDWDKGLLTTTWPHGGRQEVPMLYCDEVWTGIEFQVASHMLFEGLTKEAMHIIRAAYERHDGRWRSPWNEIECGDHYARPMSSWWMLEAAGGRAWHGPKGLLAFDPRVRPGDFRSFFITGEGWGSFAQQREERSQRDTISLAWGKLALRTLRLGLPEGVEGEPEVSVHLGGAETQAETWIQDGRLFVHWGDGLELAAEGGDLSVRIAW